MGVPSGSSGGAGGGLSFFTNDGNYMSRIHCLSTEAGTPDWPWIIGLIALNLIIITGYLKIFFFWRRSYLAEAPADRNGKMMDLAYIFLWCAVCGYGMATVIFFWPAYRLLAIFLAVLAFFTWRFVLNLGELGVSLAAVRLKRLSLVADKTNNAVIITDPQGRIDWVNAALCRQSGYSSQELVGQFPTDIFSGPASDHELYAKIHRHIEKGERFICELLTYNKDRSSRWIHIEAEPLHSDEGKLTGYVSVETDITIQKTAQFEMMQAKERAEAAQTLAEQAQQDAEAAMEEAEAASRAKSDFLASMSHELRTPLNGVIGMTELLRNTELNARQARFVDACHASGRSLLALINDVLDLSKIEAGKLELDPRPFPLRQCVDDTVAMLAGRAHESGLELVYQFDDNLGRKTVVADDTRLRQVLVNLVGNAVKFTDNGHVRLAVSAGAGDAVRFDITDTGPGISDEGVARLFKAFSQADCSTTRNYGGTGLGLSICKSIVEAMGGSIGVESQLGDGSTFWFEIPLPPSDDATPADVIPPSMIRGMRAWLIGDNFAERNVLQNMLEAWEIEVTVSDVRHATQAADDEAFDLLIIDVPVAAPESANRLANAADKFADKSLLLLPVGGAGTTSRTRPTVAAFASPRARRNCSTRSATLSVARTSPPPSTMSPRQVRPSSVVFSWQRTTRRTRCTPVSCSSGWALR